jgi:cyclic pyranopterin phosphate synthase
MPLDEYEWLEKSEVLSFEEIARLARLFVHLGVEKIRLTGGEPLARRDLHKLVAKLSTLAPTPDVCLTTNGSFLVEKVAALKAAGLRRINVSVDSLKPDRFRQITKRGDLGKVLEGLFAAKSCGLHPIKINAVIERGVNDDEILDLVAFSREHGFAIRFIEYMDVGNANQWQSEKMVSKKEILEIINTRFPLWKVGRERGSAPAVDYQFLDGSGDIGVIASVTEPFCGTCTRARITADGRFVTCLFSNQGYDLKKLMRGGAADAEILEVLSSIWSQRKDRYSEERLAALRSPTGYDPKEHRKIEMISLGG